MKSAMIVAALCAAFCVSTPAVQAKGMTDVDVYCKFFPLTTKCAPAKPAAPKVAVAKPAKVAPAKPTAVASMTPKMKMMACVKAEPGKGYLYSCKWK